MEIDLRGKYSGKQVVEALKRAGTFKESDERIWKTKVKIEGREFQLGSNGADGKFVPSHVSVEIYPYHPNFWSRYLSKNQPKKSLKWKRKKYISITTYHSIQLEYSYKNLDLNLSYHRKRIHYGNLEALNHDLPLKIMTTITNRILKALKENEKKS